MIGQEHHEEGDRRGKNYQNREIDTNQPAVSETVRVALDISNAQREIAEKLDRAASLPIEGLGPLPSDPLLVVTAIVGSLPGTKTRLRALTCGFKLCVRTR